MMFGRYAIFLRNEANEAPGGSGDPPPVVITPKPPVVQPQPDPPKSEDGYSGAFKALQEHAKQRDAEIAKASKRIAELEKALTEKDAAITERDGRLDALDKRGRESEFLRKVSAKLPHAEELVLGGVIDRLHAAQKIDKYADDATRDEQIGKALGLINSEAPSLAKPPGVGGGSGGVPLKPEKPAGTSSAYGQIPWR